jgi:P22 coat protein - gene protein 5
MANTILNPSIIAKAAVRILDNELVMGKRVYRGYEEEFGKKVNGYEPGDTISIRKPNQFTVRSVIAATVQDVTEGKLTMTANLVRGVDFGFTSQQLTLNISELSERVIKPAMVQLANAVDAALMAEFFRIPTWVGQPAIGADAVVDSFAKFARATERLDQYAVPQDDRSAVLSPESNWGLAGSQTALFLQSVGQPAYRTGEIGVIGGVSTYMSQNVPTWTAGTGADAGALVNGAAQNVTYATVLNTESVPGTQNLITDTWGASVTITKGTVFTIAGVFAVNPVTKATLPFLQHFTVLADVTADGTGNATLSITPAIITSGAFQSVSAVPADNAALTVAGAASGAYRQNMVFHKNAFALAMVPMVKPAGAVDVARESYKGISVRLIPYYDGTNDVSNWRCDVLFAVKTVDPRLAVRLTGGASTI